MDKYWFTVVLGRRRPEANGVLYYAQSHEENTNKELIGEWSKKAPFPKRYSTL
ncbi:hypothetical protein KIN20_024774 [Parelaphostrongylus tenuis]|uniref:Uncharacterized protein n=1 Tax=Parelaphostrongylus tenuis TaxID=148309 RepID=A0AAD5QW76_PARTN|nr:hypothetical protein KIN20_024774 [Parelaphostrongylus tenuis]